MELRVFESNDGALIAMLRDDTDPTASDELHPVGEACVPANALSPEMLARLDFQGFAIAQRGDVRTLIRAMDTWVTRTH